MLSGAGLRTLLGSRSEPTERTGACAPLSYGGLMSGRLPTRYHHTTRQRLDGDGAEGGVSVTTFLGEASEGDWRTLITARVGGSTLVPRRLASRPFPARPIR
jgi:hypothetical protein